MIDSKEVWIEIGYETFAVFGENGLKIELLARKAGISKSSFYHHFADVEVFVELLLAKHLRQTCIIADKELKAKNIEPELINILIEHKIDLLFNRQLRINQKDKDYRKVLTQSTLTIKNAFVTLWIKDLNLAINHKQAEGMFELALENFLLQISIDKLNHNWLAEYFTNLKRIARNLISI